MFPRFEFNNPFQFTGSWKVNFVYNITNIQGKVHINAPACVYTGVPTYSSLCWLQITLLLFLHLRYHLLSWNLIFYIPFSHSNQ